MQPDYKLRRGLVTGPWTSITMKELMAFVGMKVKFGIVSLPELKNYVLVYRATAKPSTDLNSDIRYIYKVYAKFGHRYRNYR